MTSVAWAMVALAFPCALLGTMAIREWARQHGVVDLPNDRTAHSVPTPRGGGLAIVGTVLMGVAIGGFFGWVRPSLAAALLVGGVAIAIVSWLDDVYDLPVAPRLIVQILAAAGALAILGGVSHVSLGILFLNLGVLGNLLVIAGMVWITNAFNFMDGSDGLAATEAVIVAIGGALIMPAHAVEERFLALLMAAAALGFLVWNRPRASIFMGDVGSCFCGFYFGVLIVTAKTTTSMPMTGWVVLLSLFVADASLTLLRRLIYRHPLTKAHSMHAFQRLIKIGWSHGRVLAWVIGIDIVLIGAAWSVVWRQETTFQVLGLTAAGLVAIYAIVDRLTLQGQVQDQNGAQAATYLRES